MRRDHDGHSYHAGHHPPDDAGLGGVRRHQIRPEGHERRAKLAKSPKILERADGGGEMLQDDGVETAGPKVVQKRPVPAHQNDDGMSPIPHRRRQVPHMDLGPADRVGPGHNVGDLQTGAPSISVDVPTSCPGRDRVRAGIGQEGGAGSEKYT